MAGVWDQAGSRAGLQQKPSSWLVNAGFSFCPHVAEVREEGEREKQRESLSLNQVTSQKPQLQILPYHHSKWSKSERERQTPYDTTYTRNLKYDTNKPVYERESGT